MAGKYSLHYFKRPISQVSETDLVQFFTTQQEESDTLELKSYINYNDGKSKPEKNKEKLNSIISTICAFLNSEGGILIWGAPEEGREKKPYTGSLTPVEIELSKDQLMSKIVDSISPLPTQINITNVAVSGGNCYILEVNKSEYSPHQYKGTYYMRIDGATHTAPHHYVEALMKKISYPKLKVTLAMGDSRHSKVYSVTPIFIQISNDSPLIVGKNIYCEIAANGCFITEADQPPPKELTYSTIIVKFIGEILHHGMPKKIFLLILTKDFARNTYQGNLKVSVWSENSPVLYSEYTLSIYPKNGGFLFTEVINKNENNYIMDMPVQNSDEFTQSENAELLKIFIEEVYDKGQYLGYKQN
jgi:hypothetical protein